MLKLKFAPFAASNWNYPMNTPEFNKATPAYGIRIVTKGQDVTFCDLYRQIPEGPVIAFDRRDSSVIGHTAYKLIEKKPDTMGFTIPCLALEPEKAIVNYHNPHPLEKIDRPVEPITTMLWSWFMNPKRRNGQPLPKPRKQDIRASFLGTVYYPNVAWTTNHRHQLMKAWPNDGTFGLFSGRIPNVFTTTQHYEVVARSRIVVSPHGVTEVCVRDYEAVIAGAITIKPKQSKMRIYENPWHEETTIYCKQDWSDLEDALEVAEDLWWDTKEIREHHSQEMEKSGRNMSRFAKLFCESIHTIMKGNP